MSRTIGAALKTHFGLAVTTRARLTRIERIDGTILGLTGLDRDVVYDDDRGSVTYRADIGGVRSAIAASATWDSDTLELAVPLLAGVITAASLRQRRWAEAGLDIMEVNYADLTQGHVTLWSGRVADATVKDGEVTFLCESRKARWTQELPLRVLQPGCPYEFGDAATCGFPTDPPAWAATTAYTVRSLFSATIGSTVKHASAPTRHFECSVAGTSGGGAPAWNTTIGGTTTDGSVTWITRQASRESASVNVVTSALVFSLTYSGDAPDGWHKGGRAVFNDGPLAGLGGLEIESWVLSTKTLTLWIAAPEAPVSGNSVTLVAGCAKDKAACQAFRNNYRAGSFWDVPGEDAIFRPVRVG